MKASNNAVNKDSFSFALFIANLFVTVGCNEST